MFAIISGVSMGTMEIPHSQEDHVCLATVIHLAVFIRAVTIRASAPVRKASKAGTAPSVLHDTSLLPLAASVSA